MHYFGCANHFVYLIVLGYYINFVYYDAGFQEQERLNEEYTNTYAIIMAVMMLYPLLFEFVQINMLTLYQYFFNWTTFINLLFLGFGIGNSYLHYFYSPYTIWPKFTLVMTIVFSLLATLLYLRVFQNFSGIVTMLVSVILDFKGFLFLFTLLLVSFSLIFGIL